MDGLEHSLLRKQGQAWTDLTAQMNKVLDSHDDRHTAVSPATDRALCSTWIPHSSKLGDDLTSQNIIRFLVSNST